MSYRGDYAPGAIIYGKFTTFRPSTGAAFTLAGTPALSVYKDNNTDQSTTGVTLTADFDSVTGLNHFTVDTSNAFYSAGSNFDIVITTGTVDGVSVVGSVVASFSLHRSPALRPTVAGRTLDVSSGGEAGLDWANIGSPTTAVNLSGTETRVIRRNTAQAGAASTITLDAGASSVDDFYNGTEVFIVDGTGAGQVRQIIDYAGATKVATVYVAGPPVQGAQWVTNPDNTSVFSLRPFAITPAAVSVSGGVVSASLSTAERQALANELLDLANTVETGVNVRGSMRLMLAALAGKVSGAGTGTEVFRNAVQDSKARITATVDSNGNRSAITHDLA